MILRRMISDSPGATRREHYLKLWGGLLIWICGTLVYFILDGIVLSIKISLYHLRNWDPAYFGLPVDTYYVWFGALLLLSLYQMLLYKWKKPFWNIFRRCALIVLQIVLGFVLHILILFTFYDIFDYPLS